MKSFEALAFDPGQCHKEVLELQRWLGRRRDLEERKHILPFFRKRRHLSAFLASLSSGNLVRFDRLAFEYPLFGDFTCDAVVGDSVTNAFCFIEFEGAGPESLFVRQGKKATREWSARFDHGCSQIIDWFCLLDDMRKSDRFAARFGARSISASGLLVIGRDDYLGPGERERLEWRRRNVIVASQQIQCVTFDGLVRELLGRLDIFLPATNRKRGP